MAFTVLGIDPGFASLGVARISCTDGQMLVADAVRVVTTKKATKKERRELRTSADDVRRARKLWDGISDIAENIDAVAYEVYTPFQGRTRRTANGTKVALACGLALGFGFSADVPVIPVLPADVKREVTGHVSASKQRVAELLTLNITGLGDQLGALRKTQREHASDAAGVAYVGLIEAMRWHRVSGVSR